jgi:predicted dehydrogenase
MDWGVHPDDADDVAHVTRLTGGTGADGVIITAASKSDGIVSTAFRMCRRKARVVLVGDVGLNLQRADFYEKELDFLISASYGPGRYDPIYEEYGLDYPVGFVRWTENRNMAEYLRLIADERLRVKPLINAVFPISEANAAYGALRSSNQKPLMALLTYPPRDHKSARRIDVRTLHRMPGKGKVGIALIGAGAFARGAHLPNIAELKTEYRLVSVASRNGHNAADIAKRFGAEFCTTDYQEILSDASIDAVVIATRHDMHAPIALEALKAGKHVLVEKPLALSEDELIQIESFFANEPESKPILMTGFNRRFSGYAQKIANVLKDRSNPMMITYRMNAGYIPLNHWVHSIEGGGRNIGEACHIYDLFTFLTGAEIVGVSASALVPTTSYYSSSDNFCATVSFADGSVASLVYTALGSPEHPKEMMEIFVDGKVIALDNYCRLTVTGSTERPLVTRSADKGQKEELIAFASAIINGTEPPIPLWQQLQATRISFEVAKCLNRSGRSKADTA